MHISNIVTALTAFALAVAPASAATVSSPLERRKDGCYGSGLTYSEITSDGNVIANARVEACRALAGDYWGQTRRHWCKQFNGNRINFTAENWTKQKQNLRVEDCISALTIEMNACSRGSWQWHGNFYYNNDPNVGNC